MDSQNLAILFGPNILHKSKGVQFEVESVERAEERAEVIAVVKEMIDHQADIFEVLDLTSLKSLTVTSLRSLILFL